MLFHEQVMSHTLTNDHPIQLHNRTKIMRSICDGINDKHFFGGKKLYHQDFDKKTLKSTFYYKK